MVDPSDLTIGQLLAEASSRLRRSGSESARLDAELLLGHVLGMARAGVLAHTELAVAPERAAEIRALVDRRSRGEPVAYIRGIKEFFGLAFSVDARALIPRPETELLVDLCLDRVRERLVERARPAGASPLVVWDVGTGSGAVAISVAVECRRRGYAGEVRLRATDISAEALALATENAVAHGVADVIELGAADLLAGHALDGPADVLVANLPYVPSSTVPSLPVAASYEPALALDGGSDGLDLVRRLLDQLPTGLSQDGVALFEIGSDQVELLRAEVARRLPGWSLAFHPDLAGQQRAAEVSRA